MSTEVHETQGGRTGPRAIVGGPLPGDREVLVWVHDAGQPINQAMVVISGITELAPLAVVGASVLAVLLLLHRLGDAAVFAVGVGVVWAVNPLLKEVVGRSRPDLWPLPASVSEYSFPSGHAANTAALAGGLLLVLHRRRSRDLGAGIGAAALLIVGASQLVLGRHYPSDLVAGWLWVGAWLLAVGLLRRHLEKGLRRRS